MLYHAEGVSCGSKRKSVTIDVIEDDFARLIKLLTINPDMLPKMVDMAVQAGDGTSVEDDDFEEQKAVAIAKARRRIENARFLLLEGDISQEEYLRRKEHNERQIAHWEARTTETERAAIELAMCADALDNLARLWDTANDEDRQQLARMVVEYITYDFDRQQIVDFRLKPWADKYLVLRASLYGGDDDDIGLPVRDDSDDSGDSGGSQPLPDGDFEGDLGEENDTGPSLETRTDLCPIGAYDPQIGPPLKSVSDAVSQLLATLNSQPSLPDPTLTNRERNVIIRARHAAGVSQAELARQFGISYQRVHQIVHGRRK